MLVYTSLIFFLSPSLSLSPSPSFPPSPYRGLCPDTYPDVVCRSNYSVHYYDPPLLYEVNADPGEIYNLNTTEYQDVVSFMTKVPLLNLLHSF